MIINMHRKCKKQLRGWYIGIYIYIYKNAIYSQKDNVYEQKLNACVSNSHTIFKIVNRILGSNLNPISNRLSNHNMCSYFVFSLYNKLSSIYKCITSKLSLIPPSMIAYQSTTNFM